MKIAVIGTGYVGLVTGALFADRGNDVCCIDANSSVVGTLQKGEVHFFEPGLKEIVQRCVQRGTLRFTSIVGGEVNGADVIFIAVGTPSQNNGEFNLNYLAKAARDVGVALRGAQGFKVVVGKSTVSQGTYRLVIDAVDEGLGAQKIDWAYVSNPETLAEGSAVKDFSKPDRVIIGTDSDEAFEIMKELYYPFVRQQGKILRGSPADAELSKLFANAALATRIAMFNEFAQIADTVNGADMENIRHMVCSDARIGYTFSYPGPGYGGSCFPKDVQGVVAQARKDGFDPCILGNVHISNESQKKYMAEKIWRLLKQKNQTVIAVWGLTFKPGTDDMRDAPSLTILPYLISKGCKFNVFEPQDQKAKILFQNPNVNFFSDQYEAIDEADALLLLTEWPQFDALDFLHLKKKMKGRQIFDFRNRWMPEVVNNHGFDYFGVGRNYPLN